MQARLIVLATGSLAALCVAGSLSRGMGDEEVCFALSATDFPAERIATRVDNHATAELIAEKTALNPGETTWVGVRFKIEEGWHLYWNGRNDTGSAPIIETRLPTGYSLGAWVWPAPQRHVSPGEILDHVYEGTVLLMAPLSVPGDAVPGTRVKVEVEATWVACDSRVCVAENATVQAECVVRTTAEPSESAREFEAARARQPKPWPADAKNYQASITSKSGKRMATIRVDGATHLEFYPSLEGVEPTGLLAHGAADADTLSLSLQDGVRGHGELQGVVAVARDGKELSEFYAVVIAESPAASAGKPPESAKPGAK